MARGLRKLVTVSPPTLERTGFQRVDRALAGFHAAYERDWLLARFAEGLQIRMLDEPQPGLVLFQPGRLSWSPIEGTGQALVVHDLRVADGPGARTVSRQLWSGVQSFAKFYGFSAIAAVFGTRGRLIQPGAVPNGSWIAADEGPGDAILRLKVLNGPISLPRFPTDWRARAAAMGPGVVVQTSGECAGINARIAVLKEAASRFGAELRIDRLTTPELSRHRAVDPCTVFSVIADGVRRGGAEVPDAEILDLLRAASRRR